MTFVTVQNTTDCWNHYADPSPTGSKGSKRGNYWPHGKMLGGSSSINAMMYKRGNRRDFDRWAELGNVGWEWNNVVEYFKKSEDNRSPEIAADRKHHSTGGPLKVTSFSITEPAAKQMTNGLIDMGYEMIGDINADKYLGLVLAQGTIDEHGRRSSTAKAFLVPAMDRPNLHIIKYAHVTTLDFNADKSVARVNFVVGESDKIEMSARAKKEYVMSAGALGTPQILLNSGVGPKDELAKFNIQSIVHLPVGRNLQDHVLVPYFMSIKHATTSPFTMDEMLMEYYKYLMASGGLLATLGGMGVVGYVNTLNDSEYPDVQFFMMNYKRNDPNLMLIFSSFGYQDEVIDSLRKENEQHEIAGLLFIILNPKSVGRIELKSTDPMDSPKFVSNYLEHPDDVETLMRGINIGRKLVHAKALKPSEFTEFRPHIPGCANEMLDTDDYWRCYIRHLSSTVYHPTGTSKMGPDGDQSAVVDSRLKVKGVKGLRVIDAGIMPNIVSANTNAPSIMIGEKGADFIKEDWAKTQNDEL